MDLDKLNEIRKYNSSSGAYSSEEPDFFENVKARIEDYVADIRNITGDLNKLREKVATMERDLVTRIDCSTWENVAEFIGMSTPMIQCMDVEHDTPHY